MKNNGRPANNSIITYGIRKTAGKKKKIHYAMMWVLWSQQDIIDLYLKNLRNSIKLSTVRLTAKLDE